ncbi:hypothetical protein [Ruegeria conchae]|uniref:Uncharacterized protein n=1 Tax=Ruegeria conchae TaxID=981384 RepID=A0A497ZMZ7_9RHOB|nr:hypothetical protein [Ruegeria conchae]RLK10798.1 hypothetical protein CLV75_0784 [Ruegeria conchae]
MLILIAILLFLPTTAAWISVSLGHKIKETTGHKEVGQILIWAPILCCAWITLSIIVLFNISSFPESVKLPMLKGEWLEVVVNAPVILSAVATIGAAIFAITKRLYSVHAAMTVIFCIPVIRMFFRYSSEFFG